MTTKVFNLNPKQNSIQRNDVVNFCRYHPNGPVAISPHWVTDSLKYQYLQQTHLYPPLDTKRKYKSKPKKQVETKPLAHHVDYDAEKRKNIPDIKNNTKDEQQQELLFQGAIFYIVPPPPPSSLSDHNIIRFDLEEMKKSITLHGGHLISNQIIHALKNQTQKQSNLGRTCYIVHLSGEFIPKNNQLNNSDDDSNNDRDSMIISSIICKSEKDEHSHVNDDDNCKTHLLSLGELYKKKLCTKFISVTPIWIETCIATKTENPPNQYPQLFQPQYWPMYKLLNNSKNMMNIKVSLTGFQNQERIGLKLLLLRIGATFTDNMSHTNTHLICKEAKGPKYHKAMEWGIHVVKVDWLYHIVQYGYTGSGHEQDVQQLQQNNETRMHSRKSSNNQNGDNGNVTESKKSKGCEEKFSLSFSPRRVKPLVRKKVGVEVIKGASIIDTSTSTSPRPGSRTNDMKGDSSRKRRKSK